MTQPLNVFWDLDNVHQFDPRSELLARLGPPATLLAAGNTTVHHRVAARAADAGYTVVHRQGRDAADMALIAAAANTVGTVVLVSTDTIFDRFGDELRQQGRNVIRVRAHREHRQLPVDPGAAMRDVLIDLGADHTPVLMSAVGTAIPTSVRDVATSRTGAKKLGRLLERYLDVSFSDDQRYVTLAAA